MALSLQNKKLQHTECLFNWKVTFPVVNRSFSCSEKESELNDILIHLVEFSNLHNRDRSSNATRSNAEYKFVKITHDPDSLLE